MANTYTKIYIHAVFAVKYRKALFPMAHAEELYAYMGGVLGRHKCIPLIINGMPDHVHLLFIIPPKVDVSDLVQSVKIAATRYINNNRYCQETFAWQEGFGAFSVCPIHSGAVEEYINRQQEHHSTVKFTAEYKRLLEKNYVEYDDDYLFSELED